MKRLPVITLFAAVTAAAIHLIPSAGSALEFDRAAIGEGEIWRVATGHFTHFGRDHLRWDLIAFVAFGALAEWRSRAAFVLCLSTAAVVISLGVGVLQPQFLIYRGLSGLDSALFGFVVADLFRTGWRDRDPLTCGVAGLALIGFLAKSVYEVSTGLSFFVGSSTEFTPVPLAHLLGAAVGIAAGWVGDGRNFSGSAGGPPAAHRRWSLGKPASGRRSRDEPLSSERALSNAASTRSTESTS
jgi:rhomboid family GlyGly-CTERM serine protease